MKKVVIIPGFGEYPHDVAYRATARLFRDRGYKVVFAPISWSRTTMNDWVAQAEHVVAKTSPDVLFGFSIGAMVAATLFPDSGAETLILASPSAFFHEDLAFIPARASKFLGKRRMKAFSETRRRDVFLRLHGDITILYAEEDPPLLKRRAVAAKKMIPGRTRLIMVPKTEHDLGQPSYQYALARVIK